MHRHVSQLGYTLLELSVVLLVIALIAGFGISLGQNIMQGSDRITTQQRLVNIQSALDAYAAQYGYLPCPASRSSVPTDATFGVEQRIANPGASPAARCDTSSTPALKIVPNAGAPAIYIGAIPTQTLGLPSNYAADAWGNKFLYAVSYNHVLGSNSYSTFDGPITVNFNDGNGTYPITVSRNKIPGADAVYVVLSHGADGKGAYALNASSVTASIPCATAGSTIDSRNCDDGDAVFLDAAFSDGDPTNPTYFDDYIIWGSNKLMRTPAPIETGVAQGGSSTTIQLSTSASSTDDFYTGAIITITSGPGLGQSSQVTGYVGSNRMATAKWQTAPNNTSVYAVANSSAGYGGYSGVLAGNGCAPGICEPWCAPCFNQPIYTPDTNSSTPMQIYVCSSTITSAAPNCQAKCIYGYMGDAVNNAGVVQPCP